MLTHSEPWQKPSRWSCFPRSQLSVLLHKGQFLVLNILIKLPILCAQCAALHLRVSVIKVRHFHDFQHKTSIVFLL